MGREIGHMGTFVNPRSYRAIEYLYIYIYVYIYTCFSLIYLKRFNDRRIGNESAFLVIVGKVPINLMDLRQK